jgi:hypothetical protein
MNIKQYELISDGAGGTETGSSGVNLLSRGIKGDSDRTDAAKIHVFTEAELEWLGEYKNDKRTE